MSLILKTWPALGVFLPGGRSERAASLVEYALLLALIALVCVVAVTQLGTTVRDNGYESISTSL